MPGGRAGCKWSLEIARKGALVRGGIPTTRALTEDVAETLPGRPLAIPTPGHTGGHCSYRGRRRAGQR